MGLALGAALRVSTERSAPDPARHVHSIAFVGAGGKTTAIFKLARESRTPVVVTSTTHMGAWQTQWADLHIVATSPADLGPLGNEQVTVVTGPVQADERTGAVEAEVLEKLHAACSDAARLLLIEADGSRQKPLKAPREKEPCIPRFADVVVVVAGLSGVGKPLADDVVQRPQPFSELSGIAPGAIISGDAVARVLCHPQGGLKGIPAGARRIALLNQADTHELQAVARGMAGALLATFDAVVVASLQQGAIYATHEPCAGIVLAAGGARRFGEPKQLLKWRGQAFVRAVAETALAAGLSPVVVVTGANAEAVTAAVADLPVITVRNADWKEGQASSIRAGLAASRSRAGSAMFLLADQPQVTVEIIGALVEAHSASLDAIVAPLILEETRGNPVLFDERVFPELAALRGDVGGRAVFSKHEVHYVPWHDGSLLLDIDSPEDYRRLLETDAS